VQYFNVLQRFIENISGFPHSGAVSEKVINIIRRFECHNKFHASHNHADSEFENKQERCLFINRRRQTFSNKDAGYLTGAGKFGSQKKILRKFFLSMYDI